MTEKVGRDEGVIQQAQIGEKCGDLKNLVRLIRMQKYTWETLTQMEQY